VLEISEVDTEETKSIKEKLTKWYKSVKEKLAKLAEQG